MEVPGLWGQSQDLYLHPGGLGAELGVEQSTFLHICLR